MKNHRTHPLLKQSLTRILQTSPSLFDASPPLQHPLHIIINLVNPFRQTVACLQMFRHTGYVCPKVRLLAVGDRAIDERKPIVELLRRLHGLFGVERVCSRRASSGCGRPRARAYLRPAEAGWGSRSGCPCLICTELPSIFIDMRSSGRKGRTYLERQWYYFSGSLESVHALDCCISQRCPRFPFFDA